jgi:hypothetical protein
MFLIDNDYFVKHFEKIILLSVFFLLKIDISVAQRFSVPLGVENTTQLSYSGFSNSTNVFYQFKDIHHFSVGYLYSLSDLYLLNKSNGGLNLRYCAEFKLNERLFSNAGIQYNLLFLESYGFDNFIKLNELFIFYGFGFQFTERFSISNNIGYGGYLETYKSAISGEKYSFDGYNFMIQLQVKYRL